jgi:hypothetical protein
MKSAPAPWRPPALSCALCALLTRLRAPLRVQVAAEVFRSARAGSPGADAAELRAAFLRVLAAEAAGGTGRGSGPPADRSRSRARVPPPPFPY